MSPPVIMFFCFFCFGVGIWLECLDTVVTRCSYVVKMLAGNLFENSNISRIHYRNPFIKTRKTLILSNDDESLKVLIQEQKTCMKTAKNSVPGTDHEALSEKGSEPVPGTLSKALPEKGSEPVPGTLSKALSEKGSEPVPGTFSKALPEKGSEPVPGTFSKALQHKGSENVPGTISKPLRLNGGIVVPGTERRSDGTGQIKFSNFSYILLACL